MHTTTPQLGIGISNFAEDSRQQIWDLGRDLSSSLHHYLQEILAPQTWADLAFIAVAKGPGGFTGTRIGVVAARTLGQQLNIPVYGISTLAAIANSLTTKPTPDSLIAVEMPTHREQIFTAIYQINSQGGWQDYQSDKVMSKPEWEQTLKKIQQPYQLITTPQELAFTVEDILNLAYSSWQQGITPQWNQVKPFYGQKPV